MVKHWTVYSSKILESEISENIFRSGKRRARAKSRERYEGEMIEEAEINMRAKLSSWKLTDHKRCRAKFRNYPRDKQRYYLRFFNRMNIREKEIERETLHLHCSVGDLNIFPGTVLRPRRRCGIF